MTNFAEDKLFKNISQEDAKILLEIMDIETVKLKIWTKELRLLDPKDYIPDIILELDFENLIIELQSTPVDLNFSKRGLAYVAIANKSKENEKDMTLIVLTTAEESKTIEYKFNKDSVFAYRVVNLKDLDSKEIINTVERKIKQKLKIESRELVFYALVPLIIGKDMEKYIKRVVYNLLQVENVSDSLKNLSYGIEWLIVDKFIEDEEKRNILCDVLGDRMSLIYEYGNRREKEGKDEGIKEGMKEGMKEIIQKFLNSGTTLEEISKKTGKTTQELNEILND